MARKGILYEQVAEAVAALQAEQRNVTVRAIHARTGGSMSTVLKHYRRWQYEQAGAPADLPDISPRLAETLREEMRNHARRSIQAMENRLRDGEEQLKRADEDLRSLTRELARAREQISRLTDHVGELEQRLREADERAVNAETLLQELQQQDTVRPQRKSAPPAKTSPAAPPSDAYQETFEF